MLFDFNDNVSPTTIYLLLVLFGGTPLWLVGQSFEAVADFPTQGKLNNANGIAVADYDLDGDLDIYIVASEVYDENDPLTWSKLLRNDGEAGFTDVTEAAKLINRSPAARSGSMGSKMGASWGDYDNDGYPDIFLSNYGFDELWHNEGNGQFTNVTDIAKVEGCPGCYSSNAVWWDHDKDGDLDLYVSDWIKENRFYRNDGNHIFTDISEATGLDDKGHTWASLPIDIDQNGLVDLYVINDVGHNRFYRNHGIERFEEATYDVGLIDEGDGMGVTVGDFNQDGFFDIYLTNIHYFHPNPFFINNGDGTFSNHAADLKIEDTGWGWGARFFDTDHDLDEDLYVVNGFTSPIAEGDRNFFFENNTCSFSNVGPAARVNDEEQAMGLEVFDYDLDGDQDMLVGKRNAPLKLYKNRTMEIVGGDKNWIQIELEGTVSNRNAFGSIVKIRCNGKDYFRYHSGVNLMGQSIQPIHFGLDAHQQVDEIEITWPTGAKEYLQAVAANQIIHLTEGTMASHSATVAQPDTIDPCEASIVPKLEKLNTVSVFPQPFTDEFELRFSTPIAGEISLQLSNTLGQVVYQQTENTALTTQLKVAFTNYFNFSSGTYFYYLKTPSGSHTGTLVKQ